MSFADFLKRLKLKEADPSVGRVFQWLARHKPTSWRERFRRSKYAAGPSKLHVNKPLPPEFLKATATRQTRRAMLRAEEYQALGLGTGTRPKIDAPRKVLRAIARTIAARRYREAGGIR